MTGTTSERGLAKALARQTKDRLAAQRTITLVMSTIDGRRWMYNELADAHMWDVNTGIDPYQIVYDKAQRNVGLRWLEAINRHCPAMYIRMMEEATNIKLDLETTNDDGE